MVCGEVWTGRERVLCTELWVRLGMLLLPPGFANHRFYGRETDKPMLQGKAMLGCMRWKP